MGAAFWSDFKAGVTIIEVEKFRRKLLNRIFGYLKSVISESGAFLSSLYTRYE